MTGNAKGSPVGLGRDNPWPGLTSYTEEVQGFFHGRQAETAELLRLVRREPLTVLFGQSGLGKTSLLGAGLFPRLRQQNFLPVYIRLDYGEDSPDPVHQILAAMAAELDRGQVDGPRPGPTNLDPQEGLWTYFHHRDTDFWSPRNQLLTVVLVLDQFEEIFTLGRTSEKNFNRGQELVTALAELVENRPPENWRARVEADPDLSQFYRLDKLNHKVILSLREDFLPHLEGLNRQLRPIMRGRLRLTRMNGQQALDAVLEPGRHLIDEALAPRLVGFVAGAGVKEASADDLAQRLAELEVEPALLSVVCRELNHKRILAGRERITEDLLVGSQSEILEDFYRLTVAGLPHEVRVFIEERLLTRSGYRDSVALEDFLGMPGADRTVVDDLVNHRLLRLESRFGVVRVELTHDILCSVIQASRDARRSEEKLIRERSQAAQLRRQLWRARLVTGFFAVLLILAIVASILAYQARDQAQDALLKVETTKALANVRSGHQSRGRAAHGPALLAYQRAMEEADGLAARVGAMEALAHFAPVAVDQVFAGEVQAVGWLPDGRPLALIREHDRVRAWDLGLARPVGPSWSSPTGVTQSPGAVSGSGPAWAVATGTGIQFWRAATPNETRTLTGPTTAVTALAFDPEGHHLAAAQTDGRLLLFDTATGKILRQISVPARPATTLAFSPEGQALAWGAVDGAILVIDPTAGTTSAFFSGLDGPVRTISFDPRRNWLAGTDETGRGLVWDLGRKTIRTTFSPDQDQGSVRAAAFADAELFILTREKATVVWDTRPEVWVPLTEQRDIPDQVRNLSFDQARGLLILSGSRRLQVRALAGLTAIRGHFLGSRAALAQPSPDGRWATVVDDQGRPRLMDLEQEAHRSLAPFSGQGHPTALAWSPDSENLALGWSSTDRSGRNVVRWHQVRSGKDLKLSAPDPASRARPSLAGLDDQADQQDDPLAAMVFDLDGRRLAAVTAGGDVLLWNLVETGAGTAPRVIKTEKTGTQALALGRTDTLALAVDRRIEILDLNRGEIIATLTGHQGPILALAMSPDERTLASASTDHAIRLWDTRTWRLLAQQNGHEGAVEALAFSPDGHFLVSGSDDGTVRFWEVAGLESLEKERSTGEELARIDLGFHLRAVTWAPEKEGRARLILAGKNGLTLGRSLPLGPRDELFRLIGSLAQTAVPWRLDENDQPLVVPGPDYAATRLEAARSRKIPWLKDGGAGFVGFLEQELDRAKADARISAMGQAVTNRDTATVDNLLSQGLEIDRPLFSGLTSLGLAASLGYRDIVLHLLKRGANPRIADQSGRTALDWAAAEGRPEAALVLLQRGAALDQAVARAVEDLNSTAIGVLLQLGANLDQADAAGAPPLVRAAGKGQTEQIRFLLERGAKLQVVDARSRTALLVAASVGHRETVDLLLTAGVPVETPDRDGGRALYLAAAGGHATVVDLLLNRGADPEAPGLEGARALHAAARGGHLIVLRELINRGAKLDSTDASGRTALIAAAETGQTSSVNLLLDRGASLEVRTAGGYTALLAAVRHGQLETVTDLLNREARIETRTGDGFTSLALAAATGHGELAALLLARGADTRIRTIDGRTPLILAATGGHLAVARELLARGVPVDEADGLGASPLSYAARGGHWETMSLLLTHGARITTPTVQTPPHLLLAARSGSRRATELLLDRGAEIDARNYQGSTALSWSAAEGFPEVVDLLLHRSANPEIRDHQGWTPLMRAAARGWLPVVELLLTRGVNLEVVADGWPGLTALGLAVDQGHPEVVARLLTAGARIEVRSRDGLTPLARAAGQGRSEITGLLLAHGADPLARDPNGHAPLGRAAWSGSLATTRVLLETASGRTPPPEAAARTVQAEALSMATAQGHIEVVRLLLDHGAPTEVLNQDGRTPLAVAAADGRADLVRLLLDSQANPDTTDHRGRTALVLAARAGHAETVGLLLDRGANPDIKDQAGDPVQTLAWRDGRFAVLQVLAARGWSQFPVFPIRQGSKSSGTEPPSARQPTLQAAQGWFPPEALAESNGDPNARDRSGRPALNLAAAAGRTAVMERLLAMGADIAATDLDGRTALHLAAAHDQGPAATLLLAAGANPEIQDRYGQTPLILAAETGSIAVLGRLSAPGTKMETKDARGRTALLAAATAGRTASVALLLAAHADPAARDQDGLSALELADRAGNFGVLRELLGAGATLESPPAAWDLFLRATNQGDYLLARLVWDQVSTSLVPDRTRRSEIDRLLKQFTVQSGKADPDRDYNFTKALSELAWADLLAGRTDMALATARAVVVRQPKLTYLATLAQALVLKGQFEKAREVHMASRFRTEYGGRPWLDLTSKQIAVLRQAGRDHPDFVRVEELLGLSEAGK